MHRNICCDPSSEPSHRDGSDEGSQHMVSVRNKNKSTACEPHLENSKSKKEHNFVKKIGRLPPLLVWVPLLIVNNDSEFQVNIFSNYRDIRKCQSFRRTPQPPKTPGL